MRQLDAWVAQVLIISPRTGATVALLVHVNMALLLAKGTEVVIAITHDGAFIHDHQVIILIVPLAGRIHTWA
jgi:hypothetical protein